MDGTANNALGTPTRPPSLGHNSKRERMRESAASHTIRSINRVGVLEQIQRNGPISRAETARRMGISLPTVMRIVDELLEEDLVRFSGRSQSSGGRPPSLVEFNGGAYSVVGVDLGGTKMFGALADLSGVVQYELVLPTNSKSLDDPLNTLLELIDKLVESPRPASQKIRGIGVGAPGFLRAPEGIVAHAPGLGWRDFPLRQILGERYGLPILIENDVNLGALGEWGFGAGHGVDNMVLIAIGTGIGAGIVLGGALYRGHNEAAGEIGYLLPGISSLGYRYDQFGALESLASATGIVDRARQLLQAELISYPEEALTAQAVFEAARSHKPWAQKVVDQTVDYLSLAIANVSTILDPEVIVVGGGVSRSADLIIEPIRSRLEGVIPFLPRITVSSLGPRAAVLGAVVAIWNATSDFFVLERLP